MDTDHPDLFLSKNLEIHVVDHCNLDCVGCSHGSPFMKPRLEDPVRLERSIGVLWKYYRTSLIKLLGGEPLLHPGIDKIIKAVKDTTGARVRLVTNGTLLERRYKFLEGIDEIHISKYREAKIPSDEEIREIACYLGCEVTVQAFNYFRWEHSEPRNDLKLTERIFNTCQLFHSWQCHTLRDGWFYGCPPIATRSTEISEGVPLLNEDLEVGEKIWDLLTRKKPFDCCKLCLGSVGTRFEHHTGWKKRTGEQVVGGIDMVFLHQLEGNPDLYNGCYTYERMFLPSGKVVLLKGGC